MGEEPSRVDTEVESRQPTVDSRRPAADGPGTPLEEGEASPAQNVAALESEIEETRKKLGGYVSELDRRRHAMLDTPPRRRGFAVAVGLLIAAAALVLFRRRRRRR